MQTIKNRDKGRMEPRTLSGLIMQKEWGGKLMKVIYRVKVDELRRRSRHRRRWKSGVEELLEKKNCSFMECKTFPKKKDEMTVYRVCAGRLIH